MIHFDRSTNQIVTWHRRTTPKPKVLKPQPGVKYELHMPVTSRWFVVRYAVVARVPHILATRRGSCRVLFSGVGFRHAEAWFPALTVPLFRDSTNSSGSVPPDQTKVSKCNRLHISLVSPKTSRLHKSWPDLNTREVNERRVKKRQGEAQEQQTIGNHQPSCLHQQQQHSRNLRPASKTSQSKTSPKTSTQ